MNCKGYADLGDHSEDMRIEAIGNAAMKVPLGRMVAFITDADPGKAERYIDKLTRRFPQVEVVDRLDGPVANTVSVRVRRKASMN